jgi:isoleucyl-tRNA synthetase
VAELGRQARSKSGIRLRQPLPRLVAQVSGISPDYKPLIQDELNVKAVDFDRVPAVQILVKPNLPVLGPRLGAALRDVSSALAEGRFTLLDDGRVQVDGRTFEPEEVLIEKHGLEGWETATADGLLVALDLALDSGLELEGRLNDRIHEVNVLRRESGLALTDRIRLWLPDAELVERYADRIGAETLAVSVEVGELRIEKT